MLDSLKTAQEKNNDVNGARQTKCLIDRLYREHDELDVDNVGDLSDENDDDNDDNNDDGDENINLDDISDDSGLVGFVLCDYFDRCIFVIILMLSILIQGLLCVTGYAIALV